MFTIASEKTRRMVSAMAAILVVAFAGAALDPGHSSTLRPGIVEIGELTPIGLEQLAVVTLPGLEVVGTRSRLAAAAAPANERAPG